VSAGDAALRYLGSGCAVIPIRPKDKRPLLPWREYHTRLPTGAELRSWWQRWPQASVGVVCGQVSGIVVLDCDPRNGAGGAALADRLPVTVTAESGGGGVHYYFRLSPGERLAKIPGLLEGVDFLAEAAYCIAPPSLHRSGRPYRWRQGLALGESPIAPIPPVIRQLIAFHRAPEPDSRPRHREPRGGGRLTVEEVLSRLQGVRRSGRGWMARCPAHPDRTPSLSVAAEGDTLLLHCFRGCSFAEILGALRGGRAR
jgi:hypothetical protein